jgi:hypothetical protein
MKADWMKEVKNCIYSFYSMRSALVRNEQQGSQNLGRLDGMISMRTTMMQYQVL